MHVFFPFVCSCVWREELSLEHSATWRDGSLSAVFIAPHENQ